MINHNGMFIGEIRDIEDPYKSGRYKIRIYGHQQNEQNITDDNLKWAQFLHPVNSAATSKIGILPTGPIVGSRVIGFFEDTQKQKPIILGTFPRGASLSDPSNPDVGQSGLDPQSNGVDTPLIGGTDDSKNGKTPNSPGLGGNVVDPKNAQFNKAPTVNNDVGSVGLDTSRSQNAPQADKPTIAAVDPSTNLPSALQQTGMDAQVLPNMMQQLSQIQQMMTMNNTSSGDSSDDTGDTSDSPINNQNISGLMSTLTPALTNTFIRIADVYSVDNLFTNLLDMFNIGFIGRIQRRFQPVVAQAVVATVVKYANSGKPTVASPIPLTNLLANSFSNTTNTVISVGDVSNSKFTVNVSITTANTVTTPNNTVNTVPDFYREIFYTANSDPYPGYIQWQGPAGDYVYTVRTANQPNFATALDSMKGRVEVILYNNLYTYFRNYNLTPLAMNIALSDAFNFLSQDSSSNIFGQNNDASSGSSFNFMSILGQVGSVLQQANTNHLPNSVLDQGSVANSLNSFTQNMGTLQQMKNLSNSAFMPMSPLQGFLGSLMSGSFSSSSISSSSNGLSPSTFNYFSDNGISETSINNINSSIQNTNTSSNSIATIASLTKQLETNNIPSNEINKIIKILVDIL